MPSTGKKFELNQSVWEGCPLRQSGLQAPQSPELRHLEHRRGRHPDSQSAADVWLTQQTRVQLQTPRGKHPHLPLLRPTAGGNTGMGKLPGLKNCGASTGLPTFLSSRIIQPEVNTAEAGERGGRGRGRRKLSLPAGEMKEIPQSECGNPWVSFPPIPSLPGSRQLWHCQQWMQELGAACGQYSEQGKLPLLRVAVRPRA